MKIRALAICAAICAPPILASFSASAQTPPADPAYKLDLDQRRDTLGKTKEEQQRIREEIQVLAQERSRLSQELVATAARIRDTETKMSTSEQRLADLQADESDLRKSFESQRAVLAELLAALQRMGRQPPPALLVQPEDALASVRSAILLGAVLPEIRDKAQGLADDLEQLSRVRREATLIRNRFAAERADLQAAQTRLGLLIEARQRRQQEREETLKGQTARAAELSREVRSLEDLIVRMERDVEAAREAAKAAAEAAPAEATEPSGPRSDLAALSDPGRLSPAVAFASARGMLPLPVGGSRLKGFGEADETGTSAKGLTISTRSQAQVTAPCDGWVVYAGPFRSYGQLLILNAGGGYHVLLAGMEEINVSLGQFVLTGEPVAEMGQASGQIASVIGGGTKQPVLYIEFRKDGQSIDPGPWWASSSEKVRG
jgi:septal ring factor EnvC (AmiA/AmiB activator)